MYILQVLRMAEKNTPAQQDAADLCEKGTDLFYEVRGGGFIGLLGVLK